MMKNVAAGCILVVLIIIGVLVFAHRHGECRNGRLLKSFKPCGSMSTSI